MINRREFVGVTLGAGAALALTPELLFARQRVLQQAPSLSGNGKLMQRAIPSSGEMLPVVSFGAERRDTSAMKDILKTLIDNGGRVVDGAHGSGEPAARTAANELGLQDKIFWPSPLLVRAPSVPGAPPPKLDPAAVRAALEKNFATFTVPTIDLVMVSTVGDVPTHLAVLKEMKKEGRVRYIGVSHLALPRNAAHPPFDELESIMRTEPIDFVATDYSVGDRRAEETILPLAMERKIAFMAHFTFDRGRFFGRVCSTPLPDWAAEFDAKTWAQFCVKYVLSHPAVTVARTGTTKAAHMLDNIGGGIGRLPNEATRKRMADLVDVLPPAPAGSGFSRGPGC